MRRRAWRGWAKSFGAAACWVGMTASAWATVPELVGRLTIVSQPGAAERLGVAPEKAKPLQTLIDQRIDAGTELMLEVKDLPPAEQEAKLAPFRQETEALAKKILTPEEWKKIEQAAVRELGLRSLRDPEVAGKLELTVVQQQYRDRILNELERTRSAAADEGARRAQEAEADRKLRQILTAVQFQTWQGLAGEGAPVAPAATTGAAAPATTADVVKAVETVKAAEVAKPGMETAKPAETAKPSEAVKPLEAEPKAAVVKTPAPKGPNGEPLLRFNFRFQPWGDVLDWFAQQADLSLVMDSAPAGTFNYTDQRSYTPAQAIDLLNGVLLTKGYTLVRRERMLMLVNLEDGIPANLVPYVPLEKLDASGEFELIKVLFPLTKLTPAEAELEVKPLLGPQGAVIPLLKARQLLVTDTAGRLRTVRAVLAAMENPAGAQQGAVKVLTYTKVQLADVLDLVKQLADIPPDRGAALDGSLRLAIDLPNNRIFVSGTPEKMTRMDEIFKLTDVPESAAKPEAATALEAPQLEVYSVTSADPAAVLQVLQTLLAGQPDVRLANDPKTGNIVALARPAEHATIKATLAQMQKDVRRLEVFRLRTVDPATATASITKLFGGEGAVNAPVVESDPTGGQLLVRGSENQIEQIRMLLDKLGESGFSGSDVAGGDTDRGNIRMVPLSGRAARNALEQIQQLWPAMRPNRIRVVGPTSGMPMMMPGEAPQDSSSLPGPQEQRINLQGLNKLPVAKPAPAAGRGTPAAGAPGSAVPGSQGFGPPGGPGYGPPGGTGYGPGGPGYGPPGGPGGYPPGGRDERDDRREGDDRRDRRDRDFRPDRGPTTATPPAEQERVAKLDAAAAAVAANDAASQDFGSHAAAEERVQFPRFQVRKVSRAAADSDEDRSEEAPASVPAAKPAAKPEAAPKAEAAAKEPAAKGEAPKENAWKAVDGAAPKKPAGEKAEPAPAKPAGELAPIVIVPGANGLMISSEDKEALDDFEALLATLSSRSFTGGREYTIFYLKSASAQAVADTLGMLLTGSAPSDGGGGGGGSLLGDLAGAAFGGGGGGGGGLLGGLLGLGGGGGGAASPIISSGSLQIVPEARLNALIVQGSPSEIDAVEQLLRVLDQDRLMETAISPKPRLIAIKNQPAEEIAATIKTAYADRITGGAGGGQRQPSPEEFIQMLRGGRGGRGGGGQQRGGQAEPVKFSVGVDARTNSLIVVAPQPLFEEVSQLVQTLDVGSEENAQTTKVVTVKRGNAFAVQSALSAITGQQAKGATQQQPTQRPQGGATGRTGRGGQTGGAAPNPADFFNNMRRAMEGGGGNTGRGGAGGRGATGGGFGGGAGGRGGR